jgi:hypothetical protein
VVAFKWKAATVPGKRITDLQVSKYKELRGKHGQEAAAAKTGISVASARRLESAVVLPSQRPPRHWRTRADPLAQVWDAEVVPMLEGAPSLMAVTVLEELQRRHPERFADAVLRTLQRRVSQWRAEHGGEREIYFAQEHPPGRLGLSDFTVADELDISLGGLAFPHRLYQFALAHSGWRHARVVLGGESFQSLAAGLQDALWMAGGVPQEHRAGHIARLHSKRQANQPDRSVFGKYVLDATRLKPDDAVTPRKTTWLQSTKSTFKTKPKPSATSKACAGLTARFARTAAPSATPTA